MCRGFMGRDLDLLASGPGLIQKREVPGFYGSGSFPGFPFFAWSKREVPGFYGSGSEKGGAGILWVGIFLDLVRCLV